jgi:hypothetical protein
MRKYRISTGCGLILAALCAAWCGASEAATLPPEAQSAVWVHYTLNMRLLHLPRRYPCADLRSRIRDVLLLIGARPEVTVLPRRCERALGPSARSPSVRLAFDLAQANESDGPSSATVQAIRTSVRLEAGSPRSLDANDCELLRQLKSALLEKIP